MTISNPVDRKKIKESLQEISNSMIRISAERDLIKEIKSNLAEEYEVLSKKQISKMAKVYHNQNFTLEQQEFNDFETLYEEVVNSTTRT